MQEWVHYVREEGDGDDDGQRVEVREEIVGCPVCGHGCCLCGADTADTPIVKIVDDEVEEDLAGGKGAVYIVDKPIVPGDGLTFVSRDAIGAHH